MAQDRIIRTRFAPSPTGPLHMGGVRTALYSYLFAKKHGGEFLLRIEDTDRNRFVTGAEEYILESLEWCGLQHHGTVTRQSDHREKYRQVAEQLVAEGHAYYAFDTNEELEQARRTATEAQGAFSYDATTRAGLNNSLTANAEETKRRIDTGMPYVIRLKVPPGEDVAFSDLVRGEVTVASVLIDDKVLLKSDGMPTYHLAHIIDDHLSGITHAIRGEEWLPSAPAHILIYRFLGWEPDMPQYAHLPLILKPSGKGKLSKRDGDAHGFPVFPIRWEDPDSGNASPGFRESGFYAGAFVNMLALMGWNPGTEQEIFSLEELSAAFSFEHIHKAPARFDPDKAKWFNQQWLQREPTEEMGSRLKQALGESLPGSTFTDDFIMRSVNLLKPRIHFEKEILETGIYLFKRPAVFDQATIARKWKPAYETFFADLTVAFTKTESAEAGSLESAFNTVAAHHNLKPGSMLQLLRILVSGRTTGIDLFPMLELFGIEETCERIAAGMAATKDTASGPDAPAPGSVPGKR